MKKFLLCIALALSTSVYAQPPQPTHYDLQITGSSSSTYRFTVGTTTCNLAADPGTGTTVNPRLLVWDDINVAGRFCMHDTGNNTGPLFALPIGAYTGVLYAVVVAGTDQLRSNPSNPASFSRLAQPAARTGFHVSSAS